MNILIVGNGFDLSHYLPTKYDHFMDVMRGIEKNDLGKPIQDVFKNRIDTLSELILKVSEIKRVVDEKSYQMNFDDLFAISRDKNFIKKTKEIYDTTSIIISLEQIVELQYKLQKNCWYQYFKNHVEEIKTWIDFEQKIEEVLIAFAQCVLDMEKANAPSEIKSYLDFKSKEQWKIKEKNFNILNFFKLWIDEEYTRIVVGTEKHKSQRPNLNPDFCHGAKLINGFNSSGFLDFLHQQLDEFIAIFDQYLELVVKQLNSNVQLKIDAKEWLYPDQIYSFNYTNTYQRLHDNVEVEYLHGSSGQEQNIVLGVSDLEDESLKRLKAYGFTKYHQKLFKDTDYLFLDDYKNKATLNKKAIDEFKDEYKGRTHVFESELNELKRRQILNLKFFIWGHSLDISDKDYILDLFSLNDDMDRNVRVTVYYFDKPAKFSLLNNLLAILGKDKVEHWMKNKWLCFESNPEIKFITQENSDVDQAS